MDEIINLRKILALPAVLRVAAFALAGCGGSSGKGGSCEADGGRGGVCDGGGPDGDN